MSSFHPLKSIESNFLLKPATGPRLSEQSGRQDTLDNQAVLIIETRLRSPTPLCFQVRTRKFNFGISELFRSHISINLNRSDNSMKEIGIIEIIIIIISVIVTWAVLLNLSRNLNVGKTFRTKIVWYKEQYRATINIFLLFFLVN